jgi:hypothetical protein
MSTGYFLNRFFLANMLFEQRGGNLEQRDGHMGKEMWIVGLRGKCWQKSSEERVFGRSG